MEQNILERILEGSMKPTNLSLETLQKITDGFSTDRIIGEGGFGTVYKGDVGSVNVAVKRIKSSMTINDKLFRREVDNLMEVNHQNVVRFLGLCSNTVETPMKIPESREYIYAEIRERLLCFEYISNGSLDTRITDELRGLEWDTRYQIIKGICAGLHYLHMEKHILHMDLKPANILLDNLMVPKITDFGLSRPTENSQTMTTNHFASRGYSAPENIFGCGKMSVKSDMYSLGVIIIEMVTGHRGTVDSNNTLRRWRHRWNKAGNEIPLEYHQQVTECIKIGSLCQKENPYARPFISDIMSKFVEMENLNNHGMNANESTVGQKNLPTWEDDMLGVEPLELQFGYNKQEEILSCLVELSNDTDGSIFFEIQKMRPLPYSIKPNKEIVKPRSKFSVDITLPVANMHALQYSTSSKQYTMEFIVRSIKVNRGLTTEDINEDMFDKHTTGHNVDEIHLAVISDKPCNNELMLNQTVRVKGDGTVAVDVPSALEKSLVDVGGEDACGDVAVEKSLDGAVIPYGPPIENWPPIHIVMLIVGTREDVQPFVAIGKRLQDYGHRVRLATHANYKELVLTAGLKFFPLGGDPEKFAEYMVKNKRFLPSGPSETPIQRKQMKEIIFSLLPACEDPDPDTGIPFKVDAVIANPPAYGHTHVAEALRVPIHIFCTMPWMPTSEPPHPLSGVKHSAGYRLLSPIVSSMSWLGKRDMISEFREKKLNLRPARHQISGAYGSGSAIPHAYIWSPCLVPVPKGPWLLLT